MEQQTVRYKYRIYPTNAQQSQINQFCGAARWLWNEYLSREVEYYRQEKKFHWYTGIAKQIKPLKEQHPWLKQIPSQVPQQVAKTLDQALRSKFRHGRGFPKYKKKRNGFGSYSMPQTNNHIRLHGTTHVQLPKLGLVRIKFHRELPSEISSATVIRDQDRYYVSFVVRVTKQSQIREIPKHQAIGIDLGLSDFITTSDGAKTNNLKPFRKKQRQLRIRQRRLSKKTNASNNREKQRIKTYKVHRKIKEQRKHFHHVIANDLLNSYDLICAEDLNVKGLMRTKLAKSISDTGWSNFVSILQYKAELLGKSVVSISRFDPSSKTCNRCGTKQPMPLHKRTFVCDCGHTMDRDHNAALNILDWGYKQYTVGTTEIYASQIRAHKTNKSQDVLAGSGEEAECSLDIR